MRNRLWWLTEGACLLPMIIGTVLAPQLPEQVASHWSITGEVNGHLPKPMFLVLIPVFTALLQAVIFPKIQEIKPLGFRSFMTWLLPALSILLQSGFMWYALEKTVDMRVMAVLIIGVLMMVIGNYLPKQVVEPKKSSTGKRRLDPNKARILGYLFLVGGLLAILLVWLHPLASLLSVVVVLVVMAILLMNA